MGKIKNWSRTRIKERPSTRPYYWEHDMMDKYVAVTVLGGDGPRYRVSTSPNNTIATADTKKKAREAAVRWMRKHPLSSSRDKSGNQFGLDTGVEGSSGASDILKGDKEVWDG